MYGGQEVDDISASCCEVFYSPLIPLEEQQLWRRSVVQPSQLGPS